MQPKLSMTETQSSKTSPAEPSIVLGIEETACEDSLTETNTGKTEGENIEMLLLTESKTGKKSGRPPKPASSTAVTWSVRGVERETRAIIEKAAERAGKTLGQYLNDDVRGFAQGQLSQAEATVQAVASPRDLQVQVEQLTQLVEGIAARMNEPARKGFWQRVFGK
jgi:hypothetical protein